MSTAKERKRELKHERRGLLVEQLARSELARNLQTSMLAIPLVRAFVECNVRWRAEDDGRGGTAVVATLDPNYAALPFPEARREAIEALLEEHIGGLFLLPATRRARAKALCKQIEALCTAAAPQAAHAGGVESTEGAETPTPDVDDARGGAVPAFNVARIAPPAPTAAAPAAVRA